MPATPLADGTVQRPGVSRLNKDSILRWFEHHADRIHSNYCSVGNIVPRSPHGEEFKALLRYPTPADTENCSRAVTRGVEIVASAIFVPEMGMFVYSIRMRLLAPEDDGYMSPEQRGFESCQLQSRYWKISKCYPNSPEPRVEEVRGDGVIGAYPLLYEGRYINYEGEGGDMNRLHQVEASDGYFSYQSCTESVPGSLEGSLQFRPGSVYAPTGEIFDVRVAEIPLKISHFLY